MSKGRYKDAEKVLRRMAVENQRNFEPEVFAQLQEEQEKVSWTSFVGSSHSASISLPLEYVQ